MSPIVRRGAPLLLVIVAALAALLFWMDAAPEPATPFEASASSGPATPLEEPLPEVAERPPEETSPRPGPVAAREREGVDEVVVRGRVESGLAGTPVPGGRVVVLAEPPAFVLLPLRVTGPWRAPIGPQEPLASAEVDAAGRFELRAPNRHGYLATAATGCLTRDVVPVPTTDEEVVLRVEPAGRLVGRVTRRDGSAVALAEVSVKTPLDPMRIAGGGTRMRESRVTTGDDGRFAFDPAPAGESVVQVSAPDHPRQVERVDVRAGGVTDVTVILGDGHGLSGTVVDERGTPVGDARVSLSASTVDILAAQRGELVEDSSDTRSASDGSFTFAGLRAGEYDVVARHDRHATGRMRKVRVPAAGGPPLVVVLAGGRSITGEVVDSAGAGVAGAVVGCYRPRGMFGMDLSAAISPKDVESLGGAWTTADAEGRFSIPPLPDGSYDLVASAKGYANGALRGLTAGTGGHRVSLERSGSIHGIVLSREDAEPVTSYWIGLVRPFELLDMKSYVPPRVDRIEAQDGTFSLEDVDAGDWTVVIGGGSFGRAERPVVVTPGEAVRGVIVLLPPEARVEGRVVSNATGAPIEGATVSTRSGMEALRADPLGGFDAVTDAEGRFELRGLAAGALQLSVRAADHAPGTSARVTLAEGTVVDDLVIRLDKGAVIRGRVTGPGGEPVSGALMQAILMGTVHPAVATTGPDGRYELTGLAPGAYTVNKIAGRLETDSDEMMAALMEGLATRTIRVKSGEEVELDFAAAAGGTVRFSGRVTEAGDPVRNAILSLTPDDLGDLEGQMRLATTDGEGEFVLEAMQPGDWTLTVQSGSPFGQSTKQTFDVSLPDAPEHRDDFALAVTGFAGTVTADVLRRPLEGVRVAVDALDEGVRVDAVSRAAGSRRVADVFTAKDGSYRVRGLPPGRYRAVAGGPGMFGFGGSGYRRSAPREVSVRQDELVPRIDFELLPGGSIAGRVVDDEGRAVSGATVFLVPGGGGASERHFGEIVSDEAGRYHADGLEPDRYTMVVKANGFAPAFETVRVREAEETVEDVVLRTGALLTVDVTDAHGGALAGAKVRLFAPDGTELTQYVTIGDALDEALSTAPPGHYALGALLPGTYALHVSFGSSEQSLEVHHGGADQVIPVLLP